mmetsp:Transcript_60232/g.127586  ORF Transcript_60232/g.127586 Transcript_60232/m.127586 type:complete len:252 (-) Transcript_60232:78-833(-)|eukprot:CAMPEP_0206420546 /NCGR_PEP_ID=MMETSP0324_2-20121206/914_1 /ASSEMBLY_ACC=CAM_ASM_000836 /TAXON_ID=2866 /ORGANISM="Crypthecodinium cohnii, Strain Seligo" /LENGTH=251 /DNA_ID=CAMNT_0053884465 /DNA_START=160 /DNA_END=915 /DNA_ORIENTATION=-
MRLKELFYVANIIDYGRIVTLYWAYQSTGTTFALWYSVSYILDAFDGYAARALNQESRLGYYLDMVIDRVSSCLCLHFAATAVATGQTFVPDFACPIVALTLRVLIVVVELLAHGVVMYLSEVLGVHQKQMGYDFKIVRMYLSDKRFLGWACFSFEGLGLGLIMNSAPLVLISLPGFLFRAVANVTRLMAVVPMMQEREASHWPAEQKSDGEVPRRGSSDRLGHHRAASPSGAQVVRRTRSSSNPPSDKSS